jgi:hypothetical protein
MAFMVIESLAGQETGYTDGIYTYRDDAEDSAKFFRKEVPWFQYEVIETIGFNHGLSKGKIYSHRIAPRYAKEGPKNLQSLLGKRNALRSRLKSN